MIETGLRFAKRFNPFLSAKRPCSGLFGALSHLGPPIAPNKIAFDFLQASNVEMGSGSP